MKIVIANPPWYYHDGNEYRFGIRSGSRWPFTVDQNKDFTNRYRPFPFWLAYSHSLLINNKIDSKFIDSITSGDSYVQFYNSIFNERPEYLFFEISTPSYDNDIIIAKILHEYGIKVLVGGTHATVFADELIKHDFIYAIFKGEYEFSLLNFIKNDNARGIKESVKFDIDDLPLPYRDKNIIWQYRERTHGFSPFQISILTSRGCPFNCIFCQWPKVMYSSNVRFRKISYIEHEIKNIVDDYGKEVHIYIDDETFNLKQDRTIEISEIFARHNLKWSAMCRVDTIDNNAWQTLFNNGMRYVNLGIESASPKMLQSINKKLDIEKAESAIKFINSIGIKIHLTFTNFPFETKDDIKLTQDFYNRVNVYSKQQSTAIPLPGTIWWESLQNKNNIDFDGYKTLERKL